MGFTSKKAIVSTAIDEFFVGVKYIIGTQIPGGSSEGVLNVSVSSFLKR